MGAVYFDYWKKEKKGVIKSVIKMYFRPNHIKYLQWYNHQTTLVQYTFIKIKNGKIIYCYIFKN